MSAKKQQEKKTLTRAEEQLMHILWDLNGAYLREVMDALPEPKPHQNTVATFLKIMVDKGFVEVEVIGRIHKYVPAISKDAYSKRSLSGLVKNYFSGSYKQAVSFLVEEDKLSIQDLELLLKELKKK
ncbi:BlaI/MecI/CopY family transcriptional regulator [Haoranjiania flava]|uniref:BlaI/MecI/CopY family transcriptional regulator n=1 Tax=Haoranjiania flava TaxID=1856322 RepID=A0AAE3LKB1_9BACT|nr:BlaI/MecI/CopY family transcriptional regulator [Haoranjiania flava]MCU7694423.1 BlaI/MecI/CopY family transcriptional regulator [Haoranjiania flava]